jgi:hypothetical protein
MASETTEFDLRGVWVWTRHENFKEFVLGRYDRISKLKMIYRNNVADK